MQRMGGDVHGGMTAAFAAGGRRQCAHASLVVRCHEVLSERREESVHEPVDGRGFCPLFPFRGHFELLCRSLCRLLLLDELQRSLRHGHVLLHVCQQSAVTDGVMVARGGCQGSCVAQRGALRVQAWQTNGKNRSSGAADSPRVGDPGVIVRGRVLSSFRE